MRERALVFLDGGRWKKLAVGPTMRLPLPSLALLCRRRIDQTRAHLPGDALRTPRMRAELEERRSTAKRDASVVEGIGVAAEAETEAGEDEEPAAAADAVAQRLEE